ncbi:NAD(P)-binding protein [Puniceicoccales bacterium CK1056]|uniref:NAD(P)-binding protein n=1 Tax=Oceanipulchritudo coccoides TaxID=2706888 RepID=A0A6B2M612_9BACT|nr:FAD-dependent oxidoreductase [Oceanipulchritudo coccoides]NDV63544.1 NAD(P)-binding protein [Oceanipulchritudo coccoides]
METVAIVGTGIAGMSCAHRIHRQVDLTLYESQKEPGGHTHTVDLVGDSGIPVDTGFMVYNETTYPLLTQLFSELKVETFETDMSFGVQYRPDGIEYSGSSLNALFAQRRNMLRPRFIRMIRDILRFNKLAVGELANPEILDLTLEGFIQKHGFSQAFMHYYLVPMTSAIWSTPPDEMLGFPAHTLIRFMYNHGLLGVRTHHQWRTVKGGSRQYRDKLIAPFKDKIRCNAPVTSVRRDENGVRVRDASGEERCFDKVVMATHADTTLKLLEDPTDKERELLGSFEYGKNKITLHTDASVLPQRIKAWASWNYRIDEVNGGARQASTHYWMNALQKLPTDKTVMVSVNEPDIVDREKVAREFTFDHPMFSKKSVDAQFELPHLNENRKLYFCGSYFRYGFHEDGILSGYAAADRLLTHSAAYAKLAI